MSDAVIFDNVSIVFGKQPAAALIQDEQEPQQHEQGDFPVAMHQPCQGDHNCNDDQRRWCLHDPQQAFDQRFHCNRQAIKEPSAMGLQPIKDGLGCLTNRDFCFAYPFHRGPFL